MSLSFGYLATIKASMLRSIAVGLFFAVILPAQKKPVTVDAVINAPGSRLGVITWAPDGERYIFIDRGELSLYDVRSGKERSVLALDKLQNALETDFWRTDFQRRTGGAAEALSGCVSVRCEDAGCGAFALRRRGR